VDAELATLSFKGLANDTITLNTNDGRGGSNSQTIAVAVTQPMLIGPTSFVTQGQSLQIAGLSINDGNAAALGETIAVVLSDPPLAASVALSATTVSGATVSGNNTTSLTLSGGFAAVNAELATLIYGGDGSGGGTANLLAVAITDSAGGSTSTSLNKLGT